MPVARAIGVGMLAERPASIRAAGCGPLRLLRALVRVRHTFTGTGGIAPGRRMDRRGQTYCGGGESRRHERCTGHHAPETPCCVLTFLMTDPSPSIGAYAIASLLTWRF